jgi:protein-S-isoprenylcysteine O-methyltransferase Ste14
VDTSTYAAVALAILGVILLLTFFVRVIVSVRQTGMTGVIGLRAGAGALEKLSGVLFIGGIILGGLSPLLVLADSIEVIDALDAEPIQIIGLVIAAIAGLAIFGAQLGMGASWRIGVQDDQGTDLVTSGWFSLVRNPIYTSMIGAWVGIALMVPTWLGIVAVVIAVIGLEMQVRLVEEPYLLRAHGDAFRRYAARVGRFVPGLGRLSSGI